MSGDLLREAAQKMRELADAATSGPWVAVARISDDGGRVVGNAGLGPTVADTIPLGYETRRANAALIAAMGPDVARAVADWLDALASQVRSHEWSKPPFSQSPGLAVARAFLGRQS